MYVRFVSGDATSGLLVIIIIVTTWEAEKPVERIKYNLIRHGNSNKS